jgi:hypothetical protein
MRMRMLLVLLILERECYSISGEMDVHANVTRLVSVTFERAPLIGD